MSKLRDIIELHPPVMPCGVAEERFLSTGHACPNCNGRGCFWGINAESLDDEEVPCGVCHGSGKVEASVRVSWRGSVLPEDLSDE